MFSWWNKDNKRNESTSDFDDWNLDEFDLDADLGFEARPVDKNRSPAMDALSGMKEGTISTFRDTDIEDAVKRALPREYSTAFEVKDQVADSFREMRDQISKEFEQNRTTLKAFTNKIVKGSEAVLPKALFVKLNEWSSPDAVYAGQSRQARENAALTAELSSIFDVQRKMDEKKEERQDKKEEVKGLVQFKQFQDTFAQLDAIRKSTGALSDYQDTILLKYHRKDLENSIKQTNLLMRLVEETAGMRGESKGLLERIQKNTGLPDFVKLQGFEGFMQVSRNRIWNTLIDKGLHGNNFIANFIREAKQGATGWGKGFLQGIAGMAEAANSASGDLEEFGISKSRAGGQILGSSIGEGARNRLIDYVKKQFKERNPELYRKLRIGGAKSEHFLNNLGYYVNQFAQDKEFEWGGVRGKMMEGLMTLIRNSYMQDRKVIEQDKIQDLYKPAVFTNRVSKSITDIIPGYLARILREMTIIRTGNDKTELLLFNHKDNKFSTEGGIKNAVMDTLVNKSAREDFLKRANRGADVIDKDKSLTEEERRKLARLINTDIRSGRKEINKDYYTSVNTYKDKFGEERAKDIARLMQEYLVDDENDLADNKVNDLYRVYGSMAQFSSMANLSGNSQLLADTGYLDHMKQLGIVDDKNTVSMEDIYDYLTGEKAYQRSQDNVDSTGTAAFINGGVNIRNRIRNNLDTSSLQSSVDQLRNSLSNTQGNNRDLLDQQRNDYLERIVKQLENPNTPNREEKFTQLVTLVSSIKDTSALSADALEAVKALLAAGIVVNSGNSEQGQTQQNRGFSNLLARGISWTTNMSGKAVKWGSQKYLQMLGGMTKLSWLSAKGLTGLAGSTAGTVAQGARTLRSSLMAMDVYVGDEELPRLTAAKMRVNKYTNMDGSPIRVFKDIKGAVLEDGNVVITEDEFYKAHVGNKKEGILANFKDLVAQGTQLAGMAGLRLGGLYASGLVLGWKALKWSKQKLIGIRDAIPADIYIRGRDFPVLTRAKMLAGEYFDQATGAVITKVSDIKGNIVDKEGNVLLTLEEIKEGLYDKYGNAFSGVIRKAFDISKNLAKGTITGSFNLVRKGWNKARELLQHGVSYVADPTNTSGIRDRARDLSTRAQGLATNAWEYVKESQERFKASFDKLSTYTQELLKNSYGTVDVLERIYKLLDNRLPGKKRLGDMDGDGDVENSVADILENRKKEKEQNEAINKLQNGEEVSDKKGKSLFGKLWSMVKWAAVGLIGLITGGVKKIIGGAVSLLGKGLFKILKSGGKLLGKGLMGAFKAGAGLLKKGIMAALGAIGLSRGLGGRGGLDIGSGGHSKAKKHTPHGKGGRGWFGKLGRGLGRGAATAGLGALAISDLDSAYENFQEGDYLEAAYDAAWGVSEGVTASHTSGLSGALASRAGRGPMSRIGMGIGKVGKFAGKTLGPAGLAIGGITDIKDLKESYATGNRDLAIEAGSSLGGTGAGAAIGFMFGGPVGALVGAGIGSLIGWLGGMGANKLRHHLKKGKLTEMEEIRFIQYGFDPSKDKDKIDIILNTELYFQDALVEKNGQLAIDEEKLQSYGQELLTMYGANIEDGDSFIPVLQYLSERFQKVFLANMTVYRAKYPKKLLEYMDRIPVKDKVKLIQAFRALPSNIYNYQRSPFRDKPALSMSANGIKLYLQMREGDFAKQYVSEGLEDADSFMSRPWFESQVEKDKRLEEKKKELEKDINASRNEIIASVENKEGSATFAGLGIGVSTDVTSNGVLDKNGNITLDAIRAVRYLAYGIRDTKDVAKIGNLLDLEQSIKDSDIEFSNNRASYKGDMHKLYKVARAIFTGSDKAIKKWLEERFIPVYLKYRGVLLEYGVRTDDQARINNLNPAQKLIVARKIIATIYQVSETTLRSVWLMDYTPWSSYPVGTDKNICTPYLEMLETEAKKSAKVEDKTLQAYMSDSNNTRTKSTIEQLAQNAIPTPNNLPDEGGFTNRSQSTYGQSSTQGSNAGGNGGFVAPLADGGGKWDAGPNVAPADGQEVKSPTVKGGPPGLQPYLNAKLYRKGTLKNGRPKYVSDNPAMNAFLMIESSGDAGVVNSLGYAGLGQFKSPAWSEASKYVEGGLPPFSYSSDSALNPGYNFAAIKGYMIANANQLARIGVPVEHPAHLYLAHQQGSGGFGMIYKAATRGGGLRGDIARNMRNNPPPKGYLAGPLTPVTYYEAWKKRFEDLAGRPSGIKGLPSGEGHPATPEELAGSSTGDSNSGPIGGAGGQSGGYGSSMSFISPTMASLMSNTSPISGMDTSIQPGVSTSGNMTGINSTTPSSLISNSNQGEQYAVDRNDSQDNVVATRYGGNSNSMAAKAARIAASRAGARSQHRCARYVREALEAAGFKVKRGIGSAYMYAEGELERLGFTPLNPNTPPIPGDIMTIGRSHRHVHGHICIFDGNHWYSDFKQNRASPYRDKLGKEILWRYGGKGNVKDTGEVATPETAPTVENTTPSTVTGVGPMVSNDYTSTMPSAINTSIGQSTNTEDTNNASVPQDYSIPENNVGLIGGVIQGANQVISSSPSEYQYKEAQRRNEVLTRNDPGMMMYQQRRPMEQAKIDYNEQQLAAVSEVGSLMKEQVSISKEQLEALKQIALSIVQLGKSQMNTPEIYKEPKEMVASNTQEVPKFMQQGDSPKAVLGTKRIPV